MYVAIVKDVFAGLEPARGEEAIARFDDVQSEACASTSLGGSVQGGTPDLRAELWVPLGTRALQADQPS